MNGLPDVAGSLFTSTYRNVKLAGKQPPAANLSGTGSVSARACAVAGGQQGGTPSVLHLHLRRTTTIEACAQAASSLHSSSSAGAAPDSHARTVQCFDTTTLSPAKAGSHRPLDMAKEELPVWSKSTMSYKWVTTPLPPPARTTAPSLCGRACRSLQQFHGTQTRLPSCIWPSGHISAPHDGHEAAQGACHMTPCTQARRTARGRPNVQTKGAHVSKRPATRPRAPGTPLQSLTHLAF